MSTWMQGTNAGMGDLDEVVAEGGQVAKPTPVAVPGAGVDGEVRVTLAALGRKRRDHL